MTTFNDLFPETLGGPVLPVRFDSSLLCEKYQTPLAAAEFRPLWDDKNGVWTIGWFCYVCRASADEWIVGKETPADWPWYRPASPPTGRDLNVALAVAARAMKIVLAQIKQYGRPKAAKAADELIDVLELQARRWLGAID